MSTEKKRIAWTTDLHLDHASPRALESFLEKVSDTCADALLVTGDISGGHTLLKHLDWLDANIDMPLWFVLGNHDFYNGSIDDTREAVESWAARNRGHWLGEPAMPVLSLTLRTALVGVDGWYDARFGMLDGSVSLNDFNYIRNLKPFYRRGGVHGALLPVIREIADSETVKLSEKLDRALASDAERIIVATHVPPFADAAWHEGKRSSPSFLPFFSCRSMGEMLVERMERHPDKEMLVLCGHTHGSGTFSPTPRIKVVTGGASYGQPGVSGIVEA